jgi:hypothetical protein
MIYYKQAQLTRASMVHRKTFLGKSLERTRTDAVKPSRRLETNWTVFLEEELLHAMVYIPNVTTPRDYPGESKEGKREWLPIEGDHAEVYRQLPERVKRQFKDEVYKYLEQLGRDWLPTKE